jgi:uncharacterized protein
MSETPTTRRTPPATRPWSWWQIAIVVLLVLLPILVGWWYRAVTALPRSVTIATGPASGRYRVVAEQLADSIRDELGLDVRTVSTSGSFENLRLLRSGEVDFAIVQADVGHAATVDDAGGERIAFVANLYSEVVHLVVRRGIGVETPDDLAGTTIGIGRVDSGDRHSSLTLLEHLGLTTEDVDVRPFDYAEIREAFDAGTLDVAVITSSPRSPILRELLSDGRCDVVDVPFAEALSMKRLAVSPYVLPAGLYRSRPPAEPRADVSTVAVRAQLLCRAEAGSRLVEEVARVVVGKEFVKRNELDELYFGGTDFARDEPAFDVHPGAEHVFDPALQPLLDPNFVEATEGIRSFAVSLLIGLYLLYRWIRDRRIRLGEHALDRYIRDLLEIERRQLELDDEHHPNDLAALQELLDELTRLRQHALRDFSAHELREDRATDCFLEMCHALSDKINAKITRQRLDRGLGDLRGALRELAARLGNDAETDRS